IDFQQGAVMQGRMRAQDFNPFQPAMGYVCNQLMFNFRSGPFLDMFKDYPKSDASVANVFAFFGRHITDPDLLQIIKENSENVDKTTSWKVKLIMPFVMAYMLFFGCRPIPKIEKSIFEKDEANLKKPVSKVPMKDKLHTAFIKMA